MKTASNAIVVAVGPDGADSALRFALDEARLRHCPVHLVHVLQITSGEAYAGVYEGALEAAQTTLATALDRAAELAEGDVAVTGEVVDTGWVVGDLAHHTGDAALLVLQRRPLGRLHRLLTGSVTRGVAGRAHVPVVAVPAGWTHDELRPRVVTVAVQDPDGAPALVRTALEEAQARRAAVVVLHAWWFAPGPDAHVVDPAFSFEWSGHARHDLEGVLEPLRREFPLVELSLAVRHAPPVDTLLSATESSDLMVLGRHHHLLPLGSHLGPVARGVLARSACPVMLVPEPSGDSAPRLVTDRPTPLGTA